MLTRTNVLTLSRVSLAALMTLSLPLPLAVAQERDFAREAVTNLNAYAAFKMGKYDEAKKIWEGLAEKGNTTALLNLANMFQQGQGVSQDDREAHELVEKAAALGDPRAQYEL